MILDDKALALRLSNRPEFLLRLVEFLQTYDVSAKAALVIQARPAPDSTSGAVDIDDARLQKRFLAGAEAADPWWQGFHSMIRAKPTFHGIASLPAHEQPAWASEVHRDGHFIAGVWKFPDLPSGRGAEVKVIPAFYVDMFTDFFKLVASTLQLSDGTAPYEATATLVQAPELHFAQQTQFNNNYAVSAKPLTIDNLQWPVSTAEVGTPHWAALATRMGKALTGAYGASPPRMS
ncbi:MAG: hypothetical protein ABI886_09810 [Betaproteobacteria bacterium]